MRDNDGRKLDHQILEALRLRTVDAIERGEDPRKVAATLGMHKHTVYGWVATARAGGLGGLETKPIPGRPPKLTDQQMGRVYEGVVGEDPRQLQFDFALWTRKIVGELIRREFGVEMSDSAVGCCTGWGSVRGGCCGVLFRRTRRRSPRGKKPSSGYRQPGQEGRREGVFR